METDQWERWKIAFCTEHVWVDISVSDRHQPPTKQGFMTRKRSKMKLENYSIMIFTVIFAIRWNFVKSYNNDIIN